MGRTPYHLPLACSVGKPSSRPGVAWLGFFLTFWIALVVQSAGFAQCTQDCSSSYCWGFSYFDGSKWVTTICRRIDTPNDLMEYNGVCQPPGISPKLSFYGLGTSGYGCAIYPTATATMKSSTGCVIDCDAPKDKNAYWITQGGNCVASGDPFDATDVYLCWGS
jgi:hypothetical protein